MDGSLKQHLQSLDWLLIVPLFLIMGLGLVTNFSADGFTVESLFFKQVLFVSLAAVIILLGSRYTYTFLKGPLVSVLLFLFSLVSLVALLLFAPEINGAHSWFIIGPLAVQPVEFVKIALIVVLARYFANRHIHIQHIRHVVVSLGITLLLFLLVLQQPDLGSSVIFIAIWAGMIFVSGVSKKHIAVLLILAAAVSAFSWQFIPQYQQERILAFVAPLEDRLGSGYTAHQSKIAIGSGQVLGKGVGEGTQSKLDFLPLHESDFVFAAYAEELGFIGVIILFGLFGTVAWRLLVHAVRGRTNFETLVTVGVFMFIFSHMLLHIGVNAGVFPVTGITLPFMSYGGSHLIAEAIAIALVLSMTRTQFPGRV